MRSLQREGLALAVDAKAYCLASACRQNSALGNCCANIAQQCSRGWRTGYFGRSRTRGTVCPHSRGATGWSVGLTGGTLLKRLSCLQIQLLQGATHARPAERISGAKLCRSKKITTGSARTARTT